MSEEHMASGNRDCGGDLAAYALGALDDAEALRFRDHLETCVVCRDELSALRQVVDVLPMAAPRHPAPSSLRRRVLRVVADDEPRLDRASSRRRRSGFVAPRPRLAFGGAAASLAVAVVVVVLALGGSSSSSRVIAAQVSGSGDASLRVSGGHAELVVHRFAAPPAGKVYEVWLQHGSGTLQPTTALFETRNGDADVDVPGNLRGVSRVLVTPEPAGGSPKPTHAPVITAKLA